MKSYILIILLTFSFYEPNHAAETKVEKTSPSVTYMFDAALHGCLKSLHTIKTEEEFKTQLVVARQTYLLCYAYWYIVNVEKIQILDKQKVSTISSLLRHLKRFNFDIRSDLSVIRGGEKSSFSEKELQALHHLISFPCSLSDFVSDEKYAQLANDFNSWSKQLVLKK
jgi:hypothetical protein